MPVPTLPLSRLFYPWCSGLDFICYDESSIPSTMGVVSSGGLSNLLEITYKDYTTQGPFGCSFSGQRISLLLLSEVESGCLLAYCRRNQSGTWRSHSLASYSVLARCGPRPARINSELEGFGSLLLTRLISQLRDFSTLGASPKPGDKSLLEWSLITDYA